jgi:hypothetical protein
MPKDLVGLLGVTALSPSFFYFLVIIVIVINKRFGCSGLARDDVQFFDREWSSLRHGTSGLADHADSFGGQDVWAHGVQRSRTDACHFQTARWCDS